MRAISNKPKEFGNNNLHTLAKIDLVESRLKALNERYVEKCEIYGNPIIGGLISDYEEFSKGEESRSKTFLGGIEYLKGIF